MHDFPDKKLGNTIGWLERSIGICSQIGIKTDYTDEEYDAFETVTSRYSRAIDLVEFEQPDTLIDTVNRAGRRGFIDNVSDLRAMTDLRNEIAHDYIKSELVETFENTLNQTPRVIALARRIQDYVDGHAHLSDTN